MGDWLAIIGREKRVHALVAQEWARALRARPYMEDLEAQVLSTAVCTLVVQGPRGYGYSPVHTDAGATWAFAGRPRLMDITHEEAGARGFGGHVERLRRDRGRQCLYDALTGMFAIIRTTCSTVEILTDQMGSYPVYISACVGSANVVAGTHAPLVARAAGRHEDVDDVSCAELLVKESITFPYTTAKGVSELAPGSSHLVSVAGDSAGSDDLWPVATPLWLPREPSRWPGSRELSERLESALRFAGADMSRGSDRVAVSLSGGKDSRLVLSSIPESRSRSAITFCDDENNEVRVARMVAERCGVPHTLAVRDPEYYAELPTRVQQLIGLEHSPRHAHSFVIRDHGLEKTFDLLLGGLHADALLKGGKTGLEASSGLWRYLTPGDRRTSSSLSVARIAALAESLFRAEVAEQVVERMQHRLTELARLRPKTADSWQHFYPSSRAKTIAMALTEHRLFASDQLVRHRCLLDVAVDLLPELAVTEIVYRRAFKALAGPVASIERAGRRGYPADASKIRVELCKYLGNLEWRMQRRLRGPLESDHQATDGVRPPWLTNSSWVDQAKLMKHSARWGERTTAAIEGRTAGYAVLERILKANPVDILTGDKTRKQVKYLAVALGSSGLNGTFDTDGRTG